MASFIVENIEGEKMHVKLSPTKMRELMLSSGDTVLIKNIKQTVCKVLTDKDCPDEKVRMSRAVRNNLRVNSDENVRIESCPNIEMGREVHFAPINSLRDLKKDVCKEYLKRYFENPQPIHTNDTFLVHGGEHPIQFKVVGTNPSPFCTVAAKTDLNCGDSIKPNDEDVSLMDKMLNISRENDNLRQINNKLLERIFKTEKRLNDQEVAIKKLYELFEKQNKVIEKQNKVNEGLNKEIEDLNKKIEKQNKVIEKQNKVNEVLNKEIEDLIKKTEKQDAYLKSIQNALDAIRQSSTPL